MSKGAVPAAPASSFPAVATIDKQNQVSPASKQIAPLDAAFLRRTYHTCIWFGAIMTLCVYLLSEKPMFTWSFAGGALLSALLLKSQEMFARRLLRPKDAPPYEGWDAILPLWVLVPLKYVMVVAAIAYLFRHHLINPVGMILGISVVQFAILAKVMGRILSKRMRPVGEVYVRKSST